MNQEAKKVSIESFVFPFFYGLAFALVGTILFLEIARVVLIFIVIIFFLGGITFGIYVGRKKDFMMNRKKVSKSIIFSFLFTVISFPLFYSDDAKSLLIVSLVCAAGFIMGDYFDKREAKRTGKISGNQSAKNFLIMFLSIIGIFFISILLIQWMLSFLPNL